MMNLVNWQECMYVETRLITKIESVVQRTIVLLAGQASILNYNPDSYRDCKTQAAEHLEQQGIL